jgi:hypothetical protein
LDAAYPTSEYAIVGRLEAGGREVDGRAASTCKVPGAGLSKARTSLSAAQVVAPDGIEEPMTALTRLHHLLSLSVRDRGFTLISNALHAKRLLRLRTAIDLSSNVDIRSVDCRAIYSSVNNESRTSSLGPFWGS